MSNSLAQGFPLPYHLDVTNKNLSSKLYTKQISEYMLSIFSENQNLSENNIKIEILNY